MPIFGVYLGSFGNRNHFYGANGRWITSIGIPSLFAVSHFASPAELAPILAKVPQDGNPDIFDEMRLNEMGPSREDGAKLIDRMTEFSAEAERIYQANLARLESAQTVLADPKSTKYLSLFEMANELLPATLKTEGRFPPTALYAVHVAIQRDETMFYPLTRSSHSHLRNPIYEVSSKSEAYVRERIAVVVRDYVRVRSDRKTTSKQLNSTLLGKFAAQARAVVLASRKERPFTPYGIIQAPRPFTLTKVDWSETSKEILTFLEWWASYDLFEVSSRFHAHGALILRALDIYQDVPLDQATAWTFLQEIGFIPPWEIPSRYRARFPNATIISGAGLMRDSPGRVSESTRQDIASGSRKLWDNSTVFCIDAKTTSVIDDGVSLERTDRADEFWIHVHIADPASGIQPDSKLCRYMELIPQNIYLQGHFQAMLPSDIGEADAGPEDFESRSLIKQYSLQPRSPALTFSAKVNLEGDMLEYKIEPSIVEDVKYLDPHDVSRFCNQPTSPPLPKESLTVGSRPARSEGIPNRPLIAAKDLDESNKDDLLQLHRLAESLKRKRLQKGAWPYYPPKPSITVEFPEAPKTAQQDHGIAVPGEPYIHVAYEPPVDASVVSSSMVLAGEIAARWCSDRGIPIPYRRNTDLGKNRDVALDYATKELYPLVRKGVEPTQAQRTRLLGLIGGVEISSNPGPFFFLGLDMYTKATSPLRRFADLLVHWQIHAALEYERRTGRTIDPSVDKINDIVPFTDARLNEILPFLQLREGMAKTVARGQYEWVLMALLRAWKFEQTAPHRLLFSVNNRLGDGVRGTLDLFELDAFMDVAGLDGKALRKDISVGDRFEVELSYINIHSRDIRVKALRYLGGGEGKEVIRHALPKEHETSSGLQDLQRPMIEAVPV